MSNNYALGYGRTAMEKMANRTAEKQAQFFLPHLRSGMRVLDCGCGPGSISVGLASVVSPGEVIGVDIDANQVDLATSHAAAESSTAKFVRGDVRKLQFEDEYFDAVFGHGILIQFQEPSPVLNEVWRVLKPGGFAGFRELVFSSSLYEPETSAQAAMWKLFARLHDEKGGDFDMGRRLGAVMEAAGFEDLVMSASFNNYSQTPQGRRSECERNSRIWEETVAAQVDKWTTQEQRASLSAALRNEAEDPTAFFVTAWREIVGWKAPAAPCGSKSASGG